MVNYVIIAFKHAFSVLRGTEDFFHILVARLYLLCRGIAEPIVLLVLKIELNCVVIALVAVRTALDAIVGSVCRSIFALEVCK